MVVCSSETVGRGIRVLYEALQHLAPALVVMEDVDLVVGDRRHGASGALVEFLVAIDGAVSRHHGVVTIATTNDVDAIDAAAKRAARFDVVVRVPLPDATARAAILDRYLDGVATDVDTRRVASGTDGASGADLRELVTLAVLHTTEGEPVTTHLLVHLASTRSARRAPPGQYL